MPIQKKVCLLGDFAVGKTSLVRRFVEGRFDDKYLSTIGVKISRKEIKRPNDTGPDAVLHLLLWDLAGGDDFTQVGSSYLRGAAGALIVCDLTRRETLQAFTFYTQQLQALNVNPALVIVGNKADLTAERTITDQALRELAPGRDIPCLLTSAKTGQGVEEAFQLLAEKLSP
jgi:small GTP-binding protein